MRKRLGETNWHAFVRYAEAHYKPVFLTALLPPDATLRCAGKLSPHAETSMCPCDRRLCLATAPLPDIKCQLAAFHLDHTHDAAHICQVWSTALPAEPTAWDDGVCGPLVAHLLFVLRDHPMADADPGNPLWQAQLIIRCGNTRGVPGQRASDFCHDTAHAHYTHPLTVEDLRFGETHDTANKATNTTDTVHGMEEYATEDDDEKTLPPDEQEPAEALVEDKAVDAADTSPVATPKEGTIAALPIIL